MCILLSAAVGTYWPSRSRNNLLGQLQIHLREVVRWPGAVVIEAIVIIEKHGCLRDALFPSPCRSFSTRQASFRIIRSSPGSMLHTSTQ